MIFDLQKAGIWKRASAFLFDAILFGILAVGFAFLVSEAVSYDTANDELKGIYTDYEETYGVTFGITQEEFEKLSTDERAKYEAASEALSEDADASRIYMTVVNLTLLITSLGILFSFIVLEFIIPLVFKNGQTLGKKIFGLCLIRPDGVKISNIALFVRTVLGKYTVETMIPVLIVIMLYFNAIGLLGVIILIAVLILQIILLTVTRTNSAIHDLLANTVVVNMSSQMIFESDAALLEYEKKKSAESSAREKY